MAEKGLWQSIRSFVAEHVSGSEKTESWSEPAQTPEGAALGFEWDAMSVKGAEPYERALLWPDASEAMEIGPLAGIDKEHPAAEWTVNGGEEGFDRSEAMNLAEENAAKHFIEPLAEASESYYAKLAALAENRSADVDRDASDRDFGLDL